MTQTIVTHEAAERLRRGLQWVRREEIAAIRGTPRSGEPVELLDEEGRPLGVGDLDLEGQVAAWRLAAPGEVSSAIFPTLLRNAWARRARTVEDPRYCRLVHGEGDGLPGLTVDRYQRHLLVETSTAAMEGRLDELALELRELLDCESVVQKRPGHLPHARLGNPPRWGRLLELGARMTFDLSGTPRCGYPYDARELRRLLGRLAEGARVLELRCGVGGLFVHTGLGGARRVLALDQDDDQVELARENADANGLWNRAHVERLDGVPDAVALGRHDLVILTLEDTEPAEQEAWLACAVGSLAPSGQLAVVSRSLIPPDLREAVARHCEDLGRWAVRLTEPSLPPDYPVPLRAAAPSPYSALVAQAL